MDGVRSGWSAYRSDSPCCARLPMPSTRSSRVIIPGFDAGWAEGPSWPCRAMRLASPSATPWTAAPWHGPCCRCRDDKPNTYPTRPADSISNSHHHPSGSRSPTFHRNTTDCHGARRGWDCPPPSGLRAGTPDRRGKRGEVAAIFAIITTEPTWSIGELGLGITSRTSAPNISHA